MSDEAVPHARCPERTDRIRDDELTGARPGRTAIPERCAFTRAHQDAGAVADIEHVDARNDAALQSLSGLREHKPAEYSRSRDQPEW